ncbi:hypothetical protein SCHPADRAFT_997370 [Schizopora paradoxa]|uniref:F-box domain-containing protein n=1 Tax=Schizopora paradoxa TaxID=27342 RepID=A0A0H2RNP5_9AGAM|nr:hypothetical protein SCHPADRAFT_997370 [Schizopora paradoxa]
MGTNVLRQSDASVSVEAEKPSQFISIPDIVLIGVIDTLKEELMEAIRILRIHNLGFGLFITNWLNRWSRSSTIQSRRQDLKNASHNLSTCSIVHSSWRQIAQHALGVSFALRNDARLEQALSNSCLGAWTYEVELELRMDTNATIKHLGPFLSQTPNLRILQLNLVESQQRTQEIEANAITVREALSFASYLKELVIVSKFRPPHPGIFERLLLPSLCTLRITALKLPPNASEIRKTTLLLLATRAFPSLRRICVGPDAFRARSLLFESFSWRKVKSNSSDLDDSSEFTVDTLDCNLNDNAYEPSEEDREVFSKVEHLKVCDDTNYGTHSGNDVSSVVKVLRIAKSIRTLTICAHKSLKPGIIAAALPELPGSLHELCLVLPDIGDSLISWHEWDVAIRGTLRTNSALRSNLRSLKIMLSLPSIKRKGESSAEKFSNMVHFLSYSRDLCASRGIVFETVRDDKLRPCTMEECRNRFGRSMA